MKTPAESQHEHYLTPKAAVMEHPKLGDAIVAIEPIAKDELVAIWSGKLLTYKEVMRLPSGERYMVAQIGEDLFSYSETKTPPDNLNHSCEPNLGFSPLDQIVAMRDIAVGEQLTLDYAMCDTTPLSNFDCLCGSPMCRGEVKPDDWRIPRLQKTYGEYFIGYIRELIRDTSDELA
jgi:hypothetical protein